MATNPCDQLFSVTVNFTEPQFFERIGRGKDTIEHIIFTVKADSKTDAEKKGIAEFEKLARQSQVHWERIIKSVDVKVT